MRTYEGGRNCWLVQSLPPFNQQKNLLRYSFVQRFDVSLQWNIVLGYILTKFTLGSTSGRSPFSPPVWSNIFFSKTVFLVVTCKWHNCHIADIADLCWEAAESKEVLGRHNNSFSGAQLTQSSGRPVNVSKPCCNIETIISVCSILCGTIWLQQAQLIDCSI